MDSHLTNRKGLNSSVSAGNICTPHQSQTLRFSLESSYKKKCGKNKALILFVHIYGFCNACFSSTQTSTNLPVCETFSKPVLCSPVIRAAPLVPCIISGFREKASTEHHIVATSSDTTDRRILSQPLSVGVPEQIQISAPGR